jgi:hypothetical protein
VEKISRDAAIKLGLKRYFTGIPCRNGHVCERYTMAGYSVTRCVECIRLVQRRHKEHHLEQIRLRDRLGKRKQRERDPERIRQQWREWSARQKEKGNQAAQQK